MAQDATTENANLHTYKVGVVGLGRIGYLLEHDTLRYKPCTHLGALIHLSQQEFSIQIDSLCDISEPRLNQAAEAVTAYSQTAKPFTTTDYQELMDRNLDLIVLAASTPTHFAMLRESLHAHIPRIVIEKPVIATKGELRKARALLKRATSHVWVNYERRFTPKYKKVKKALSQQDYGRILTYRGLLTSPQTKLRPYDDDEGILLHDTTHLLDLISYLFGRPIEEPTVIEWPQHRARLCESHIMHCAHNGNVFGEILTLPRSPAFHFELEIYTERGRLVLGNGYRSWEPVKPSKHYENFLSLRKPDREKDKKTKPKRNPFLRLYRNVLLGAPEPDALEDALYNVETLLNS